MEREKLVKTALESGAAKAAVIDGAQVVLSDTFRGICESNGCGIYGKCWMCPPTIGEIHELMDKVRSYKYGLLYQTIHQIEDSFDIEGMNEGKIAFEQVCIKVDKAVKSLLEPGYLHLSGGGCSLCERCAILDDEPCRHPDLALPPMEGYGIDVYNTTKDTELKYINGQNTVTYFGIVLFERDQLWLP